MRITSKILETAVHVLSEETGIQYAAHGFGPGLYNVSPIGPHGTRGNPIVSGTASECFKAVEAIRNHLSNAQNAMSDNSVAVLNRIYEIFCNTVQNDTDTPCGLVTADSGKLAVMYRYGPKKFFANMQAAIEHILRESMQ